MFSKNKVYTYVLVLIFILVNFIFNFQTFKDLIGTQFYGKTYISDYTMSEIVLENIFSSQNKLFYPFQINYSSFGVIGPNVFTVFYYVFRAFLNPTASLMFIGLTSYWISTALMYLMLRKLKIEKIIAFIISLSFSYMPFLSYQIIAQFAYIMVYFFPALFLLADSFINSKQKNTKLFTSALFGLVLGSLFYTNLYYFLMSVFALGLYCVWYIYTDKKKLIAFTKNNINYLLIIATILLFFILPWIFLMKKNYLLNGELKTIGFGGAPILSADLLNFITPSQYNPIYKFIIDFLTDRSLVLSRFAKFFYNNSNRFAYPGLITLLVLFYSIIRQKKLGSDLWNKIKPHLFVSFVFATISMGPFLKVLNRWIIPLDDGISLIIPMPFLVLHYLPFFSNIRAPQRFVPIFVFFALIVVALVLNRIYRNLNKKNKIIFVISLFLIFLFDQFYSIPVRINSTLPNSIYSHIKSDNEKATVLEIPFTVRDGMQYLGFVHAISPIKGILTHNKQIIGGYLPRINSYIFEYYGSLEFLGYITKIIDVGNYNPSNELPRPLNIFEYKSSIENAKREIDFLDIKYILLKSDEKYTKTVKELIEKVGFVGKLKDNKYDLYQRETNPRVFEEVNFGSSEDSLYIAAGFSSREDGYRWAQGKLAKVFIKTYNTTSRKLSFEALSFYKPQKIQIYINQKYAGEKEISIERNRYYIDIKDKLEPGINIINFVFSKSYVPAKLWSHDKDARDLAVKFFTLKID